MRPRFVLRASCGTYRTANPGLCRVVVSVCVGMGYRHGSHRAVAQLGSAPALGAGGRQFKSDQPDGGNAKGTPKAFPVPWELLCNSGIVVTIADLEIRALAFMRGRSRSGGHIARLCTDEPQVAVQVGRVMMYSATISPRPGAKASSSPVMANPHFSSTLIDAALSWTTRAWIGRAASMRRN